MVRYLEERNEIGATAKLLDSEKTTIERMKVGKNTLRKMGMALVFYVWAMMLLELFL